MADDPIVQMAADPDFPKLPLDEQRKALAAHDPDFGKLGDEDISGFVRAHQQLQMPDTMAQSAAQTKGVIQHVSQNMQPSPFGGAHPSQEQEQVISKARPQIPGMVSDIRQGALTMGGGAIGAQAGGSMARGLPWIARTMGAASGAGAGAGAGTLAGGGSPQDALTNAAGYAATTAPLSGLAETVKPALGAAAKIVYDPMTGKVRSPWEIAVDKLVPDPYAPQTIPAKPIPRGTNYGQYLEQQRLAAKAPDPVAQAVKNRTASWIPTDMPKAAPPLGSPDNPGFHSKIPTRMPALPPPPPPELGSPENPGFHSKIPNRMPQLAAPEPEGISSDEEEAPSAPPNASGRLIVSPEEARSFDQMQKIAKTRASQRGMQYAAGMRPAGGKRSPFFGDQ